MGAAEDESTRHEGSRSRTYSAAMERGRRAEEGEQLVGVPELTRALAAHYNSLAHVVTLKTNGNSAELGAVLLELRDVNVRLGAISHALGAVVRRTMERQRLAAKPWQDPAYVVAGTMCLLAGCIIGALLAR